MPFACEFDPKTQGGKYISSPGDYTCTITGFENTVSNNGNTITNFKIVTTCDKEGKFPIFHTDKAAYKIVQLGAACGVNVLEGKRLTFKEQNFVNKKLVVRFVDSAKLKEDGTPFIELPKDKSFLPVSSTNTAVPQAAKPKTAAPSSDDSFATAGDEDGCPF